MLFHQGTKLPTHPSTPADEYARPGPASVWVLIRAPCSRGDPPGMVPTGGYRVA